MPGIISWNVNGLSSKVRSLGPSLTALGPPMFAVLLETKLPRSTRAEEISPFIPDLSIALSSHKAGMGGMALCYPSHSSAELIESLSLLPLESSSCSTQVCVYDLRETHNSDTFRLIAVYRQPQQPVTEFRDLVLPTVARAIPSHGRFAIMGDFNSRSLGWDRAANTAGDVLSAWIAQRDLAIANALTARYVPTFPRTQSVLDLALVPRRVAPSASLVVHCNTLLALDSDHHPISLTWGASPPASGAAASPFVVPQQMDWQLFMEDMARLMELYSARVSSLPEVLSPQTRIDRMAESLTDLLTQCCECYFKRVTPSSQTPITLPPEVKEAVRTRNSLGAQLQRARARAAHDANAVIDPLLVEEYEAAKSAVKRGVAHAHCVRLSARLRRCLSRNGMNWRRLSRVTSDNPVRPLAVRDPLSGQAPSSLRQSLSNLAVHFARSLNPVPQATPPDEEACIGRLSVPATPAEELGLPRISAAEVQGALARLNTASCPGPDEIPAAVLVHAPPSLLEALATLFSESLVSGCVPSAWKRADIVPVHKSGSPLDADNWRAVSVTSLLARLMEHTLLPRLEELILPHVSPFQAAFQRHRNILENASILHAAATEAFRRRCALPTAFLDLKSAYDSVRHSALLTKLERMGVPRLLLRWIAAFLSQRRFRVRHDGVYSDWFAMSCGLPQGSVLAPLLFLAWMNDLCPGILALGVIPLLVADDILLIPVLCHWQAMTRALQAALSAVCSWTRLWGMTLNVRKSAVVVFRPNVLRQPPFEYPLSVNGSALPVQSSYRYLGILFDCNLSFSAHRTNTWRAMVGRCDSFRRRLTLGGLVASPPDIVRALVRQLLVPCASYGIAVWSSPTDSQLSRLNVIAATFLRSSLLLAGTPPHIAVLAELGVRPFQVVYAQAMLSFGRHLLRLDAELPAGAMFRLQVAGDVVEAGPQVGACLFLGQQYQATRDLLQLPADADLILSPDAIRTAGFELCSRLWSAERQRQPAHRLLSPSFGLQMYLRVDPYYARVARAGLRFGRIRCNSQLHQMRLGQSDLCSFPLCAANDVVDSADHILMWCPRFRTLRNLAVAKFLRAGIPMSKAILCGSFPSDWSESRCLSALACPVRLLSEIGRVYCGRFSLDLLDR